ncbi:hypothetical protein M409DRAFT_56671 [Zasmidium cellare ATCC 36951]|uniref:Aminoglycoside phosphotransferase domain-containing protein n=1 Tax=Zasmidium cellare ATCC 36951 TaxID=1080233 RepID=A0A6A6CEP9_ZASCE|nr:uncharacterized protein M409DRAFT_56671 [Zasmidium cellare ATCC 36951]KAF2164402.1 hypothetical protein M409DRAFT_56671 [Zasmidium cellare ATCC 36951]
MEEQATDVQNAVGNADEDATRDRAPDSHVAADEMMKDGDTELPSEDEDLADRHPGVPRASDSHSSAGYPTGNLTDEDRIVAACSDPDRHLLSDPEQGADIIKYSKSCIVKFGNVSASEAMNQQLAHRILDPSIVRVPEVHHHFTRDSDGYLVMQYIDGAPCGSQVARENVEKIAAAIKHLWSQSDLPVQAPGPIGGGMTQGMLWENEEIEIEDLQDLEKYWNDRLLGQMDHVRFESSQLAFVHCDVAPRNIIWSKDGIPTLLDWAHAGIYPRSFERATLSLNTQQGTKVDFSDSLAELLPLSEEEEAQVQQVLLG